MIRSFHDSETEKVFQREKSRRPPPKVQRQAHRKLVLLDAAETLKELRIPPANRLEGLSGDGAGQHTIRINDQWRICFRWDRGDAYDVEITDYHQESQDGEESPPADSPGRDSAGGILGTHGGELIPSGEGHQCPPAAHQRDRTWKTRDYSGHRAEPGPLLWNLGALLDEPADPLRPRVEKGRLKGRLAREVAILRKAS